MAYQLLIKMFGKDIAEIISRYNGKSQDHYKVIHTRIVQHVNIIDWMNFIQDDLTIDTRNTVRRNYDINLLPRSSINYDRALEMVKCNLIPRDKFISIMMNCSRYNFNGMISKQIGECSWNCKCECKCDCNIWSWTRDYLGDDLGDGYKKPKYRNF